MMATFFCHFLFVLKKIKCGAKKGDIRPLLCPTEKG